MKADLEGCASPSLREARRRARPRHDPRRRRSEQRGYVRCKHLAAAEVGIESFTASHLPTSRSRPSCSPRSASSTPIPPSTDSSCSSRRRRRSTTKPRCARSTRQGRRRAASGEPRPARHGGRRARIRAHRPASRRCSCTTASPIEGKHVVIVGRGLTHRPTPRQPACAQSARRPTRPSRSCTPASPTRPRYTREPTS